MAQGVTITTTGDKEAGVSLTSTNGDLNVAVNDIDTAGWLSDGVFASTDTGSITIVNGVKGQNGDITTHGDLSDGIHAYAGGDIGIVSDAIHTYGAGSNGIHADSSGGAISITSTEIDTHGGGTGILAHAYGDISISSGLIATEGKYGGGIHAVSDQGAINITSGSIQTSGEFAGAIFAKADNGPITIDSGPITTAGHYSRAIQVIASGDISIAATDISTHSPSFEADGILAYAGGTLSITTNDINIYGSHSYAIVGYGDAGVSITAHDVATSHVMDGGYAANSGGVVGISANGPVDINVHNLTTSGFGLYGQSEGASVSVTANTVATSGDFAFGIFSGASESEMGDSAVNVGSLSTEGYASFGIYANSGHGTVTVNAGSVSTNGLFAFGIAGVARDNGDVVISGDHVFTGGAYSGAVSGISYGGSVTIDLTSVDTKGSGSQGVFAYAGHRYDLLLGHETFGDIDVHVGHVATDGDGAVGMFLFANSGDIDASVGDVTTHGFAAGGILVQATTVGDFLHPYFHAADVHLTAGSVSTDGNYASGVFAGSTAGSVTVEVGQVTTHGDYAAGVVGQTDYFVSNGEVVSGDLTMTVGSVTTTGAYSHGVVGLTHDADIVINSGPVNVSGIGSIGVWASSYRTGDITLNLDGDISAAHGLGVLAASAESAVINVGSNGSSPGIHGSIGGVFVGTNDGAVINNHGTISADSGLAIAAFGGSTTVNNFGTIIGFVGLTDEDDVVANSGVWRAQGDSFFGLGADTTSNTGLITIGAGAPGPVNLHWFDLDTFTNSGMVELRNGRAGDIFNLGFADFTGLSGSVIGLDVSVGADGVTRADKLIVGAAGGSTSLLVQGRAGLGPVTVIDAISSTTDAFTLPGGSTDTGLVRLNLAYDAAKADWNLVGAPDVEAFETLKLGGAAQNLWRRGGEAWSVRMQQSREGDGDGSGLWGQYIGGGQDEDSVQSFQALGSTFNEDLSTKNRWNGAQVGGDMRRGPWTFGATAGYAAQITTFVADNNRFRLSGVNAGAYAGWQGGGFYAQGLVDYLRFRADVDLASAGLRRNVHGDAWGARGEAGYRYGMGGFFLEPSVSLSWTHTALDDLTGAGATVQYGGADSLQGAAGARIGGEIGSGRFLLRPYLGLYAVTEFSGDNGIRFATGATGFNVTDSAPGTYGKTVFGVNAGGETGMQLFVSGETDFGGVSGVNGQAGLRWRW
ncbi:MAG: autotransporter domain-containing protein [Caulobacteraceae bacterium]